MRDDSVIYTPHSINDGVAAVFGAAVRPETRNPKPPQLSDARAHVSAHDSQHPPVFPAPEQLAVQRL